MKKIVVATILAGLSSAAAVAADLPARTWSKAPAVATAVTNWSGPYIGGNLGYGWGNGDTGFTFFPSEAAFGGANTSLGLKSSGVIGGAQLGYNWQIGKLVTGLEADIQGSDIKGSLEAPSRSLNGNVRGTLVASEKLSWFGTVRGRLGVTITPELLLYGTGGLVFGEIEASGDDLAFNTNRFPGSVSTIKAGWTLGAGAEWAFARQWSAKVEYLYLDLRNVSAVGAQIPSAPPFAIGYTWKVQENIVRAGVNYHF